MKFFAPQFWRGYPPSGQGAGIRDQWRLHFALGWTCLVLILAGCGRGGRAPASWLAEFREDKQYDGLRIRYPFNGSLFPSDIAQPTFLWEETGPNPSGFWVITLKFGDGAERMNFSASTPAWTPTVDEWELIKQRSLEKAATVDILGFKTTADTRINSGGRVLIQTSKAEVGAPIFYREVNLPFSEAVKDPTRIRWRFGSVSSPSQPPIVLEKLPVCGNCHSFPRDGHTLAMDVDYANSKGSYALADISPQMNLSPKDIITWDDFRREDNIPTFGFLSQISPDGRWVVSTVKDNSVFVPKPDLAYSQLFFPVKGILGVYDRQNRKFTSLPGADDPEYVQSNPVWSPDGSHLLFARAKAYRLERKANNNQVLLTPEECAEFLKEGKPFVFDLYRIPFNEGRGGKPEPIPGAATNGFSNYFPRYSPDGQWIVFCRAKNYMLLQPDSELYIVPAKGGEARRLGCNLARMNSWHSWSPNGQWLVFSSKGLSIYTQLFLTHIDENGQSSAPVCLANFTAPDRAANIPEFVALKPDAIAHIRADFLNDYSYFRAGNQYFQAGDPTNAIQQYRLALQYNPENADACQRIGFLTYNVLKQQREGIAFLRRAIELQPNHVMAHYDLGMACLFEGRFEESTQHLTQAVRLAPDGLDRQYNAVDMRVNLGESLVRQGRVDDGIVHLREAMARNSTNANVPYLLAQALAFKGLVKEASDNLILAVAIDPKVDQSVQLHQILGQIFARDGQFPEAILECEKALQLARQQGKGEAVSQLTRILVVLRKNLKSGG